MEAKIFTEETANAVLTEVFNELTEMYLNTTDLPEPDVWGEEWQSEWDNYKMVQISSTTDDNIYLVSQLRYHKDSGEMEILLIYDGLDILSIDIVTDVEVDDIVEMMVTALERMYEDYENAME